MAFDFKREIRKLAGLDIDLDEVEENWPYTSVGNTPKTVGGTTTSLPLPVVNGGQATSTGNGSTVTSTGNGLTVGSFKFSAHMSQQSVEVNRVVYEIVKRDGSAMMLAEKDTITPQEMIGISKFLSVVAASQTVLNTQGVVYNINWSQLIADLQIDRHFDSGSSSGLPSNVLRITLKDPV